MEENLKGVTILLVEDDTFNQRLMKRTLENFSAKVILANNGKEAIEMGSYDGINLILMDLQMPIMNGFEAIQVLRKEFKLTTPIIALTGSDYKEDEDKARSFGCDGYLVKPCDGKTLLNEIQKKLKKHSGEIVPKDRSIKPISSLEISPLFNLNKLQEISRGDKAFVDRMVNMFMEDLPKSLQSLKNHLEAQEYNRLKVVAHKMKPSLNMMGVVSVSSQIQRIEDFAGAENNLEELPELLNEVVSVCEKVLQELK